MFLLLFKKKTKRHNFDMKDEHISVLKISLIGIKIIIKIKDNDINKNHLFFIKKLVSY